jgi:hypothetical protein
MPVDLVLERHVPSLCILGRHAAALPVAPNRGVSKTVENSLKMVSNLADRSKEGSWLWLLSFPDSCCSLTITKNGFSQPAAVPFRRRRVACTAYSMSGTNADSAAFPVGNKVGVRG